MGFVLKDKLKRMKCRYCFLFIGLLIISGCNNLQSNCTALTKTELTNECVIVVSENVSRGSSNYFIVNGFDPYTNVDKKIVDPGRRWIQYKKDIQVGDTLIKRRGELTAYIHKKGITLVFPWKCGGKEYQD